MSNNENSVKRSKPFGIILSALYFAIANGLFSVIISILLLFLSGTGLPAWVSLLSVISLVLGMLSFAVCYGLWMLIEWGRKLAIAISIISIPLNIASIKLPGPQATSGDFILIIASIAIDILIIWYLLRDDIKSLFYV